MPASRLACRHAERGLQSQPGGAIYSPRSRAKPAANPESRSRSPHREGGHMHVASRCGHTQGRRGRRLITRAAAKEPSARYGCVGRALQYPTRNAQSQSRIRRRLTRKGHDAPSRKSPALGSMACWLHYVRRVARTGGRHGQRPSRSPRDPLIALSSLPSLWQAFSNQFRYTERPPHHWKALSRLVAARPDEWREQFVECASIHRRCICG